MQTYESPRGRRLEVVSGDAGAIERRGTQIHNLGVHMVTSADLLRSMEDGTSEMSGEAIEKLKEVVGTVHEELRLAGLRYTPSGTALTVYARKLSAVQGEMMTTVAYCESAWEQYEEARARVRYRKDDLRDARRRLERSGPDESERIQAQLSVNRAQSLALLAQASEDAAHQDFIQHATKFDSEYDDWSAAFETAANALEDATTGGVSDRVGDHFNKALDITLVVLGYAGIVMAVLTIFIGGPIVAAMAAVLTLVNLVVTVAAYWRGRVGGFELALAIVAVIPFGSMGKLAGGKAGVVSFIDDMFGGLATAAGREAIFHSVKNFGRVYSTTYALTAGKRFLSFESAMRGSFTADDIGARILGYGFAGEMEALKDLGTWGSVGRGFLGVANVVDFQWTLLEPVVDIGKYFRNTRKVDTWAEQFGED